MAEINQQRQLLRILYVGLFVSVVTAIVLIAGVMFVSYIARRRLGNEVVKISKASDPVTFTELTPGQVQTEISENAIGYYISSLSPIRPYDLKNLKEVNAFYRMNLLSLPKKQFPSDLRDKVRQSLINAEPVFAKLDMGAQLDLPFFGIGILHGREVCKNRLDSITGTIYLMSLRTLDAMLANESDKAADSIISTLKLMRVFDTYPIIFVHADKMMCVKLLCHDIQMLLSYCHTKEDRLEQLQSLLVETLPPNSFEKSLLTERVYQLEIARNLIPDGVESRYFMTIVPDLPERLSLPGLSWRRLRVYNASVRYLRDMAWFVSVSRRPLPEPLDEIIDANSTGSRNSSGLIRAMYPLVHHTADTFAIARCTTTAIAVERYRRQNGRIPDSLNDICPKYIESIPLDPYTGKELLYHRDDKSYTVYSTGINRVDDAGDVVPKEGDLEVLDRGVYVEPVMIK